MKIHPVQKQTSAGQRTRFKAFVVVGDYNGHVGLGHKCAKEVATAIRGAITAAKLTLVPVRRGYWGNKLGVPSLYEALTFLSFSFSKCLKRCVENEKLKKVKASYKLGTLKADPKPKKPKKKKVVKKKVVKKKPAKKKAAKKKAAPKKAKKPAKKKPAKKKAAPKKK